MNKHIRIPARLLAATLLLALTTLPALADVFINAGGPAIAPNHIADQYFTSGNTYSFPSPTVPAGIYKTERYTTSDFNYNIPVVAGQIQLTLRFRESCVPCDYVRRFTVLAEGQTLLSNFTVAPNTIADQTFVLTTDATLNLVFRSDQGEAWVNAIEVVQLSPGLPPSVSLTATPPNVASGSASTLAWSTTNATSCTASGGWTGARATSGSQSTGPLTATTTFTLTCLSSSGASASQSVVVTVGPAATLTFSATPTSVASGGSSTLNWSTTNVTSCTASDGWTGARAASGSQSTGPLNATTTYTLTCAGTNGGSVTQSVVVTVAAGASANFTLYARSGNVVLGDGNSLTAWGYSTNALAEPGCVSSTSDCTPMQYPGPTLTVNQGQTVTVTLHNRLLVPVSIIFPGQTGVTAAACPAKPTPAPLTGLMTLEATQAPSLNGIGGCVQYQFVASRPGTYMYQSGTRPELEVEMGLVGALIIRPTGYALGTYASHPNRIAYDNQGTAGAQPTRYDREYLFFLTEMDRMAHEAVDTRQQAIARGGYTGFHDPRIDDPSDPLFVPGAQIEPAGYSATLWFLNGRNGPDTMLQRNVGWMPTQPYNSLPRAHPGERVLMRLIGGGRDLHPFHHHGNNAWLIAQDGRVLESALGAAANYPDYNGIPERDPNTTPRKGATPLQARLPDRSISNYTIQIVPGSTYDAIFTWTGKGLNWDIYGDRTGHTAGTGACAGNAAAREASRLPGEDPGSHCKAFPVVLPEQQALTFGGFWSGGPFLGTAEAIPPLQGGLNPGAGYSFMWHSHTERELTNDDVFPGGLMTMFIVEEAPAAGLPDNICDDGSFGLTCPTP